MATFFILQAREFLSKLGDRKQTHIYAKIENTEVSKKLHDLLNNELSASMTENC